MKRIITSLFSILAVCLIANAKIVYVATTGDNSDGSTWAKALTSIPNSGSSAISAGDSVFVKGGLAVTYSFSATVSNNSAFATKADVNYLGGFTGTESNSAQRAKSDLDNNGIIEPWEFTNPTTLSFNSTNNAYGLYINSNTAKRIFDGFTITGTLNVGQLSASTGGNNMVKINNFTTFQNNILSGCTLSAAPNTATANMGYTKGALLFMGQPTTTTGGSNNVDNCLIENNTSTITPTSSQTQDVQQSPLVHIDASNTTGRNVFSNCVIRKNQITLDYTSFGMGTPTYNNPRGMIISMSSGTTYNNCMKNLVVHNNSVTFIPKGGTGTTNLGNGGLIFTYNSATTNMDSIVNCTVANNSMMRIGYAIRGGFSNTTQPYHIIANNALYNNKNDNGSGTISVQNLTVNQTPAGSAGTIIIANNVANGGTVTTANSTNVYNNLNDLASGNIGSKAPYFSAIPNNSGTEIIGYSTNTTVATSRWNISSSSYLTTKGVATNNKYDKAGFSLTSTPSVGAYEQFTPTITGATTTSAFTSTYGTASSAQPFSVSATKLYGNLVAAAPTGYEVSTDGSTYGSTATFARGTGNPSGTLYVRLKSSNNAGSYNSANTVLSTTDGTSVNISTPASGNTVSQKALTIGTASIASKVYNGSATSGTITPGILSGFVGSETVTVSSSVGTYADANVGTSKSATIVYSLSNGTNGGLATNYSLANGSGSGDITAIISILSSSDNSSNMTFLEGKDLTVQSDVELTIDNLANIYSLKIAPGAKVTLTSGKTLTTGNLTLQSDATSTGTFVDNGGTLNATTTNVQQYLSSGRNWYISSPLSRATSTVFSATNSNPLYYYDETAAINASTNAWIQIKNIDTALNPTTGYVANMDATVLSNQSNVVTFTGGSLNTGTILTGQNGVPALTYTDNNYKKGFNLVGNPYPSYLDWDNVTKTNVMGSIWLRTKVSNTYLFDTYNASGQLGTSNSGIPVNNHIPPMQAFWVRATSSGASLGFDNSMRSHKGSQITGEGVGQVTINDRVFKAPVSKDQLQSVLRLQISNGLLSDETILYSNPNALNSFDDYDTPKMFSNSSSLAEIYTVTGTEQLAINGLNSIAYDTEFPLGFTTLSTGNFSIKASQIANFPAGTQVILKDNADTNSPVITDLTDGSSYSFSSGAISNNTSRFALIFRAPSVATGINTESNGNVWISTCNGQLVINGAGNGASLEVFNAVGQKLISKSLTRSAIQTNKNLPAGAYIVKVTNDGKSITKKIIID